MGDTGLDLPEQWSPQHADFAPTPAPSSGPDPEWWRDRLLKKLVETDLPYRENMWSIYNAEHPRPTQTRKYSEVYDLLQRVARTPWGRMVVDVTVERLTIQGYRIGNGEPDVDMADVVAASRADAFQRSIHREAGVTGTGYTLTWLAGQGQRPVISAESSLQCTHELKPGSYGDVAAAVKVWIDTVAGRWRCDLYTEDRLYRWESPWRSRMRVPPKGNAWSWIADAPAVVEHKLGAVPLVPFVQRPDFDGYGTSELFTLRPLFDRIELLTTDLLLASNYGAFKQRWATGIEVPIDPETGLEVEPYQAAVNRIWVSEDPDTKFGSIDGTDLTPIVKAISSTVAEVSAIARIPSNYFTSQELANPPSAASQEAGEVNLIGKIEGLQRAYGESWDRTGDLVLRGLGRTDGPGQVSTVWKDPRRRSEAQILDAATKLSQLNGMPLQPVLEFIGYSPADVTRIMAMRTTDILGQMLGQLRINTTATPMAGGDGQPAQLPPTTR